MLDEKRLELLRTKLKTYLRLVNKSQKALAMELATDYTFLSQKLNGAKLLAYSDMQAIIKILTGWSAINDTREVSELLELTDCPDFTEDEWLSPPLNRLKGIINPASSAEQRANDVVHPSRHNLPTRPTTFIGRDSILKKLQNLVMQPHTHLVTLTGPGGVGKTRLSIELAYRLLPMFPDGVFFVELAPVTKQTAFISQLASTLNLESRDKQLDTVKAFLREKQALLILDNFEQLVEGAAELVGELVASSLNAKFIVTSRLLLELYGEHECEVAPLDLPPASEGAGTGNTTKEPVIYSNYSAIQLFIDRSRINLPAFGLNEINKTDIVELCRHLDGLPLAIELAAARVKVFTPGEILAKLTEQLRFLTTNLRNLPDRHKSLSAVIDWSYMLLNDTSKLAFDLLGIFAGSFEIAAAVRLFSRFLPSAAFGEISLSEAASIELLNILTDNSLASELVSTEELQSSVDNSRRFRLLETIRQYAMEKLGERGILSEVKEWCVGYYVEFCEQLEPDLLSPKQQAVAQKLEAEHPNIRAALSWSLEQVATPESALRMSTALGRFWQIRGYLTEGSLWLEQSLALVQAIPQLIDEKESKKKLLNLSMLPETLAVAKALHMLGLLALFRNTNDYAEQAYKAALERYRAFNYVPGEVGVLKGLGNIAFLRANYERAKTFYEEGLQLEQERDNEAGLDDFLNNLGAVNNIQGDYPQARKFYSASLELRRKRNSVHGVADTLHNLAILTRDDGGDLGNAQKLFEEALELRKNLGFKSGIADTCEQLGINFYYANDYKRALQYYQESEAISNEIGAKRASAAMKANLSDLYLAMDKLKEAGIYIKESLQSAKDNGFNEVAMTGLFNCCFWLSVQKDFELAVKLYSSAEAFRQAARIRHNMFDKKRLEDLRQGLELELGRRFKQLWEEGQSISLGDAISLFLSRT